MHPSSDVPGRVMLLGIPVDAVTMDQAVGKILRFLEGHRQHQVITPNNEMLVEAARNAAFRHVLHDASLNIPDSTGLLFLAKFTKQKLPQRVTGTDTMQKLCQILTPEAPVFLLGAKPGVAERAAEILKSRNPRLRIAGTYAGSPRDADARDIIARINAVNPAVLFVAYGAPAQELWIARHLSSLTSVKVAMGVGGAFDFVAGMQKRAPSWMRTIGLEWLWRLIREPRRFKRIWNAVAVFPMLGLRYGKETPA
jgi:N-acetylglucosaminyldiphosphoundecaprenol N-acetyl-beta-D-mannosaminyltransferase